jgi:DnaJ homolog subfamily C member 19
MRVKSTRWLNVVAGEASSIHDRCFHRSLSIISSNSYAPQTNSSSIFAQSKRNFHVSVPSESATLVLAGLGVAGGALALRYAYSRFSKPIEATQDSIPSNTSTSSTSSSASSSSSSSSTNTGGYFSAQSMARRFYKGGFEEKMTRREAALILGVRESAEPTRIRERHRKMLLLNHPDMGGSIFLSTKINEAKDLLMGKSSRSS